MDQDQDTGTTAGAWGGGLAAFGAVLFLSGLFTTTPLLLVGIALVMVGLIMLLVARRRARSRRGGDRAAELMRERDAADERAAQRG